MEVMTTEVIIGIIFGLLIFGSLCFCIIMVIILSIPIKIDSEGIKQLSIEVRNSNIKLKLFHLKFEDHPLIGKFLKDFFIDLSKEENVPIYNKSMGELNRYRENEKD